MDVCHIPVAKRAARIDSQPAQPTGVQHIAILEKKKKKRKKKTFDRICCRPADDDDVSRAVYCPLSRQGDGLIILYFTEAFRPAGCSHTARKKAYRFWCNVMYVK